MESVKDFIKKEKLIAIVRGIDKSKIVSLAEALYNGGIKCMEITVDQKDKDGSIDTFESINILKEKFGSKMCIGAGTVITTKQVAEAYSAGAEYIISPNFSREVIEATKKAELVSIPGAFTPSEIVCAYNFGADFVKVFPVSSLGVDYFRAITAPLSHIPLLAVGGVSSELISDYADAGACGFGVGGKLVNKKWIADGNFSEITNEAMRYRNAVEAIK